MEYHADEEQLIAVPLSTHGFAAVPQEALALLAVAGSENDAATLLDDLKRAYGFTDAEARVSVGLAEGNDTEEIASASGVSVLTVRMQLRTAMAKSGARRQAELVRDVLALPRLKR